MHKKHLNMGKIEKDFYERSWDDFTNKDDVVIFKYPEPSIYKRPAYDWYMIVALEKADKVETDRHLLTKELLTGYRWAIREGYQHQLDPALQREYDYPRNRNTIKGIQGYIERIKKASDRNES